MDYSDGDQETVWLPLEQVRLSLHSGEELLAPTGASLRDWGACLAASADGMQTGRLTGVTGSAARGLHAVCMGASGTPLVARRMGRAGSECIC